jgi:hypothetical protein
VISGWGPADWAKLELTVLTASSAHTKKYDVSRVIKNESPVRVGRKRGLKARPWKSLQDEISRLQQVITITTPGGSKRYLIFYTLCKDFVGLRSSKVTSRSQGSEKVSSQLLEK